MRGPEFVASLTSEMQALFAQLGAREALESESDGDVEIETLLELALQSELEASEVAGAWLASTPEIEAKAILASQCGDEMRHYQLIVGRLRALGREGEIDPLADGYSPLYRYLTSLRSTVERVAAGLFACEAIAEVRNRQFIELCRERGDHATAELYETIIQPDEVGHHEAARDFLERHCHDPEHQEAAAAAMRATLAIADELQTLARRTTGAHPIPSS